MLSGRFIPSLIILAVVLMITANPSLAERKVALVIGNAAYQHTPQLKNPDNDARAVSELFSKLGYDTQLKLDLDRNAFTNALADFGQSATNADAAIFYYAGHGVSLDGHNYLIPTDSVIKRASELKLGAAIDAEQAIDEALANAKVKLVFLDACRDNPFVEQLKRSLGSSRSASVGNGLSEMKSGDGTLIAFSTAPGQVAADGKGEMSPFARAIVRRLAEPGQEIRLAMTQVRSDVESETEGQQTPWETTNLTGFFYFNPPVAKAEPPPNNDATKAISSEYELEFWRNVKGSKNEVLLRSYIQKFPDGLYRPIAEEELKDLQRANASQTAAKDGNTPAGDGSAASSKLPSAEAAKSPADVTTAKELQPEASPVSAAQASSHNTTSKKTVPPKKETAKLKKDRKPATTATTTAPQIPSNAQTTKDRKQSASASDSDSGDASSYLNKTVTMGGSYSMWNVPAGASYRLVGAQAMGQALVKYKGRTYSCRTRGSGGTFAGEGAKVFCVRR